MLSLNFAILLLISFGAYVQTSDLNKGYPFGKLRLSEDGKTEELIPSSDIAPPSSFNPGSASNVQPLTTPCTGIRSPTKLPYPKDKTKYILCRDEYHYEIVTCPNGGTFDEQSSTCEYIAPTIDRCELEKPCLNNGRCASLSNSSFTCFCTPDYTGTRCETALSSCSSKPCGPNAECRLIKTTDFEQDYVCICNERSTYGLSCQHTVQNPCLTITEEFFPYAFSQHAFVQCDGDNMFVQPCGSLLYWNQDDKICDRKRQKKIDYNSLLAKLSIKPKLQEEEEERIPSTTRPTEQQNSYAQKGREEVPTMMGFVPARVAVRPSLPMERNNQPNIFTQNSREMEQRTQELPKLVDSNPIRQDYGSKLPSPSIPQIEPTIRQPSAAFQPGRNQPMPQNTLFTAQEQPMPISKTAPIMDSNMAQPQMRQNTQQQNFLPQNQAFGSQSWLNKIPDMRTSTNQRPVVQPSSWQTTQTLQNQPTLQSQYQQTFIEPTTPSPLPPPPSPPKITSFQGYQNTREREPIWPSRPTIPSTGSQIPPSTSFNTQNSFTQPQARPDPEIVDDEQSSQSNMPEATALDTKSRFNTNTQQNNQFGFEQQTLRNQPSFQSRGTAQIRDNFVPSEASFTDAQRLPLNTESSIGSQSVQNSQRPSSFTFQPSTDDQSPRVQSQLKQDYQQQRSFPTQTFQDQDHSRQTKLSIPPMQTPSVPSQYNQGYTFSSKQWPETPKLTQQDNIQTFKPTVQSYNRQPLNTDSYSQPSTTSYGSSPPPKAVSYHTSFAPRTSWQPQVKVSEDSNVLTSQSFNTRPMISSQTQQRSSIGSLTANPTEMSNRGMLSQTSRDWSSTRPIEQHPSDNIPDEQPPTIDQRKTFDSVPSSMPSSWSSAQGY